MRYDFTKIELLDIMGKPTKKQGLYKDLANAIYLFASAKNLNLVEVARTIFQGKEVELDKEEIQDIIAIVEDGRSGFFAFVKKAIKDYIESVQAEARKTNEARE